MNFFGMFFSFMIPGVLLGIMLTVSISSAAAARRAKHGRRA